MHPFALNILRVGISSALLWLIWAFSSSPFGIQRKHIGRFILCALTGVVINQTLFITGLSLTLSLHAALLILVTPVFITLVAFWLGAEKLTPLKVIGLVSGISGAVLLALHHEQNTQARSVFWGDVMVIVNAISYAFYFVLVRPLMNLYRPIHTIRWIFSIGLLFLLPLGWSPLTHIPWASFTGWEYGLVLFIAVGATFLAYLFNLYGIHKLGAGITGTYIYTQPVFASLIAVFLLGETITWYKVLAAMLIFAGVYLVGRKMA